MKEGFQCADAQNSPVVDERISKFLLIHAKIQPQISASKVMW